MSSVNPQTRLLISIYGLLSTIDYNYPLYKKLARSVTLKNYWTDNLNKAIQDTIDSFPLEFDNIYHDYTDSICYSLKSLQQILRSESRAKVISELGVLFKRLLTDYGWATRSSCAFIATRDSKHRNYIVGMKDNQLLTTTVLHEASLYYFDSLEEAVTVLYSFDSFSGNKFTLLDTINPLKQEPLRYTDPSSGKIHIFRDLVCKLSETKEDFCFD